MKKKQNQPPQVRDNQGCPESLLLASFIDGNLSSADRSQILFHLRNCKDCYQIVTETVRLVRDLPVEIREAEVGYPQMPSDKDSAISRMASLAGKLGRWQSAALLSPVAAVLLVTLLFRGGPDWHTEEMLSALHRDLDLPIINQSLPVDESKSVSLGFNNTLSDQKLAFKTGTLLGRLEISNLAGDREKEMRYATQLKSLLEKAESTKNLVASQSIILDPQMASIEKYFLSSSQNFYFKLGVFIESGKAYSLVEKSALFDKDYLKALINHPQFNELPPGVVNRFKEIERLINKNTVAQNSKIIYKLLQDIQQILS